MFRNGIVMTHDRPVGIGAQTARLIYLRAASYFPARNMTRYNGRRATWMRYVMSSDAKYLVFSFLFQYRLQQPFIRMYIYDRARYIDNEEILKINIENFINLFSAFRWISKWS